MNNTENLFVIASEECAEIQQVISKALRFGSDSHHPDRPYITNAEEIMTEYYQLCAVLDILKEQGHLPSFSDAKILDIMNNKAKNIEKWRKK